MVPRQALASVPYALRALAADSGKRTVRHYTGTASYCGTPTQFDLTRERFFPPLSPDISVVPIIEVYCAGTFSYAAGSAATVVGFWQGPGTPFSPGAANPISGIYTNMQINDRLRLETYCNTSAGGSGNSMWMIVAVTEE